MDDALIGYTGFVGGNLLAKRKFGALYNSKNATQMRNKSFGLVVCAAAPAVKWLANKEPEKDWTAISGLIANLETIQPEQFVLISTVDVYQPPMGVDEDTKIKLEGLHAYGKHRRILEEFTQKKFGATIVRLPGLFGNGLKKNAIYDFLQGNASIVHQDGVFQFYNLDYLWKDLQVVLSSREKLVNFATEPVAIREIARECFGLELKNNMPAPAPRYDMHTKHAALWGKKGNYIYSRQEVLSDIKKFVEKTRLAGGHA